MKIGKQDIIMINVIKTDSHYIGEVFLDGIKIGAVHFGTDGSIKYWIDKIHLEEIQKWCHNHKKEIIMRMGEIIFSKKYDINSFFWNLFAESYLLNESPIEINS